MPSNDIRVRALCGRHELVYHIAGTRFPPQAIFPEKMHKIENYSAI
jgi:hypothetical protein